MKAIVRDQYGSPDVLELRDIRKPVAKDDEVLIRVRAASLNAADLDHVRGRPLFTRLGTGLLRPKRAGLGSDVAGQVEAVGKHVTQFRPGDEVFGDLSVSGFGAFAEYVCAPAKALALKPAGMTFEQAATLPQAAVLALQAIRRKKGVQSGDHVLVNGAGGGVGTFAVQMAKSFGAEVTGVDSRGKLDVVRSLGADHVIDYAEEDYTANGKRYDRIIDVTASRSIFRYKLALKPEGVFVMVGGPTSRILQTALLGVVLSLTGRRNLGILLWRPNVKEPLVLIEALLKDGKVTAVIEALCRLDEVPDALRALEQGRVNGKLVVTI